MDLGELTGLAAVVMIFGIPIAAILTGHQRKMAEMMNHQANNPVFAEVQRLQQEVAYLRNMMNEQALQMDDLRRSLPGRAASMDVPPLQDPLRDINRS